jgi:DNA-binding NarL/FixJ family response regulator
MSFLKINVALGDEQELMRSAYQQILEQSEEFSVRIRSATTGRANRVPECEQPGGVSLFGCAAVTQQLCQELLAFVDDCPGCGVIVIFDIIASDARESLQALSVKARSGFAAVKRNSLSEGEDLKRLVRQVHSGQVVLDALMLTELVGGNLSGDQEELARLTHREWDVLGLMAQGLNNSTVAEQLTISRGTVDRHTYNIYQKLQGCPVGVQPRAYATALYREHAPTI